jgi:hypothetical protein
MTPEQMAELRKRVQGGECDPMLKRCLEEIERLRTEGVPGVMHDVDKSFYKLVVSERDAERHLNDQRKLEIHLLKDEVEHLKKHTECELGSDCPCYQQGYEASSEAG